ncbi:MAG: hypothetical protein WCF67_21260, partial [Chitinophagaceae bacterium]
MTFLELTQTLLYDKKNYKGIFDSLHMLHEFYAGITGISAEQTTDGNIMLPAGKAISPGQAANCLLDLQRTVVFMRGIHKAILKLQQEFSGQPIHILYAGCGPYATLLTPITTLFSAKDIRLHLMDVQQRSVDAIKLLYEKMNALDYVESFTCADATVYKLETPVHLAITETMQSALAKEPQVAIMQNIIPQLPDKSIFIPERIAVTAQLVNRELESQSFLAEGSKPERINLGEVYAISRHNCLPPASATIVLPDPITAHNELHLITEIDVFEDEKLGIYDCGVTLPVKMMNVDEAAGKKIEFTYE